MTQDKIDILIICMDKKRTGKSRASHPGQNSDGIALSNTLSKEKKLV